MALKLKYYGQNDGSTVPDVALVGDPGTDQLTLTNAGYLGGKIMALKLSATAGRGLVIVPCDGATQIPYGALLNGPGEFAGAIGPSGSGKAPIVRALFQGYVDSQAFVTTDTFVLGAYLYCGTGGNVGLYTSGVHGNPVAICTQIPTGQYPQLGVTSLI